MNYPFPPRALPLRAGCLLALCLPGTWLGGTVRADVIVLANRTAQAIDVQLIGGAEQQQVTIPGGQQSVQRRGPCKLQYEVGGRTVRHLVATNSVYFFALGPEHQLQLQQVDLGNTSAASDAPPGADQLVEVPVKIVVDNHVVAPRSQWEPQLRKRVQRVSEILQATCRLQLKVVAVETWNSGPQPRSFHRVLHDFRRQIDAHPAALAIGFTGRQHGEQGLVDLGVTQGMLQSHILLRHVPTLSESEHREVLLHEMGHYLGAVHASDTTSVMRPVLADGQVQQRSFVIEFDPVNTLIVNLVADDIRGHQADRVAALTPRTQRCLSEIYQALLQVAPRDKSIRQCLSQLHMGDDSPLAEATRQVVREIRRSALAQPHRTGPPSAAVTDRLTEIYLQRAAEAASRLPSSVAAPALVLGLGIGLDDTGTLLGNPFTAAFCRQIETETERHARQLALGNPTIRGRRDLAQHFFLSAYLTAVVGGPAARSAGVAKELADSRSANGLSYRDLAANAAGIHFAQQLLNGQLPLATIARGYTIPALMPDVADLPEGVHWQELGGVQQDPAPDRVQHYEQVIQRRIDQLSKASN